MMKKIILFLAFTNITLAQISTHDIISKVSIKGPAIQLRTFRGLLPLDNLNRSVIFTARNQYNYILPMNAGKSNGDEKYIAQNNS